MESSQTRSASYASGTSATPLIGDTIGVQFDKAVARWGNRDALIVCHQNIHWSYSRLKEEVDAFAAGLTALGLEPGDRVGVWSPNNAEWVIVQLATAKAGLIQVNINPAYRLAELEYALNKAQCKALITAERFKTSDYLGMLGQLAPEIASSEPGQLAAARLPSLRTLILIGTARVPGFYRFEDVSGLGSEAHYRRLDDLAGILQFDDPINIQFTSGTTGFPKGATLTHHNILNNGFLTTEKMAVTAADRLCIPVPLYHCFGMVMGVLGCITHGMAMILPSPSFDARATLEAVQRERCTALYGVPTMFVAMLADPEFKGYDLSSLRTGIMAGAPCPVDLMRRAMTEMNLRELTIAYGMTETSPVSTQTSIDDSLERRVSTVGRVHPHTKVKIIDGQDRIVPIGAPGQLCSRGYLVMRGYWEDASQTREVIDSAGWMRTGDIATMDADGYVNVIGRIKDMVIRGGENIYPREIEEFLRRHPKIEDVQVFGVPDTKYGEELCAWVRLRGGQSADENEIRAYCHGQIAHNKIPRYVRIVQEFPTTVTGKVQKFVMREIMAKELT